MAASTLHISHPFGGFSSGLMKATLHVADLLAATAASN